MLYKINNIVKYLIEIYEVEKDFTNHKFLMEFHS